MSPRPWIALGLLLAGVLSYVAVAPTEELFGRVHFDDGVFFSSAKSLADGDGYVIPNVPRAPAQTKYPVLYPWLLSWVWRLHPSFPANVGWAIWINAGFACQFLFASFLYLRRQPGVGEWMAVACVALTATYSGVLDLSASLMSDVPFMALAMTALLLADMAAERKGSVWSAAAGGLAGLALLTRTAGIAFVGAIGLAALVRRDWRGAAAIAAGGAPFVLGHQLWNAISTTSPPPPGSGRGWVQVWTYMTSYPEFWKLSMPSWDVFLDMVSANIASLVVAPAQMALFAAPASSKTFLGFLLGIALTAGIVGGLARQARSTGWTAVHTALLLTTGLCMLWNFPIVGRLLAVFLPLFCLGALVEGRHIAAMAYGTIASNRPVVEKAVSALFLAALVSLGAFSVWTHAHIPFRLKASVDRTTRLFEEEAQVYRWVESNTASSDVLLAYSDSRLYLETGRFAVWPAAFTTDILYRGDAALEEQFDHYLDTARRLQARYWIVSDNEMAADTEVGKRRLAEIQSRFPVAFRTAGGSIRIFDLSGLTGSVSWVASPDR